jgi:hypothetical protein
MYENINKKNLIITGNAQQCEAQIENVSEIFHMVIHEPFQRQFQK